MEPSPTTARIEELLTHADWVQALARNLSRDDADADDLAQETWLAALSRPPRQGGRAWLGGVTRNLSRMRWRASTRRTRREEVVAGEREDAPRPDDAVARMETQRLLADAVLRLDEPWRTTVVRRYLDGLTSAEIARQEGVPAATVRGRLKTALERLRADLDERHDGGRDAWLAGLAPVLGLSASEARSLIAPTATGGGTAALVVGVLALVGIVLAAFPWGPGGGEPSGRPPKTTPVPVPDDVPAEPEAPGLPPSHVGDPAEAADAPLVRPPTRKATPRIRPHEGTPPGMVFVPPGTAVIGTTWERLRSDLLVGRHEQVQRDFAFEAPRHAVLMDGFFMDRYEISNAQYRTFLGDTARTSHDTDAASLANLEEVAGHLLGAPRDRWANDDVSWRQLYRSNQAMLHEKMPKVVKRGAEGQVDEKATEDAFRHAPLARGMRLDFYDRKPPETWPSMEPAEGTLDLPVTSVSYDDAEAFAEWAGKHIPTEQEWEYAARGPEGFLYPWGDDWFADASHANWGGKIVDEHYTPRTLPVDSLPAGRSWCGIHHLLGNAGEWTSSWFAPYPGNEREHVSMGEYVKVLRGATYVDLEPLVLRLAARNFIGGGIKAPPRPGNRFAYVGFRCAKYVRPARDRLEPIVRRVSRARRITGDRLALDEYAGAAALRYAAGDAAHHVHVQGRSHAVVVIPMKTVLRPGARTPRIRSRRDLMRASSQGPDPIPLAVLHTDVALEKVWVRSRVPGRADATVRGTCLPGTYVLAIWQGRLCLARPSLEFVCFLTEGAARIDVRDLAPEERPSLRLQVDAEAGVVVRGLAVPVADPGRGRATVVVETISLTPAVGALSGAGTWHTDARRSGSGRR